MKIVVCVKQVPDTEAEKRLNPETLTVDRDHTNPVLNEMDEFAIEEALKLAEAHGGEVTVLTMGPDGAEAAVRKALSMGADAGIHLSDPALAGSDAIATSLALAGALATTEYDLVIMGSEASDSRTSLVPAMLAERLGLPQLTFAAKVEVEVGDAGVDGSTIRINRRTDYGYDVVAAMLPAVVSVVEKINEPRYPSFKGIMAAKKKPVARLDLAAVGIAAEQVGAAAAATAVVDAAVRPPRSAGVRVKDEGGGGVSLAEFLSAQKFI